MSEPRDLRDHDEPRPEWVRCEACRGLGAFPYRLDLDETEYVTCGRCDGAGEFIDQ